MKKTMYLVTMLALAVALAYGCSDDGGKKAEDGPVLNIVEGGACRDVDTCAEGLSCVVGICVKAGGGGGAEGTVPEGGPCLIGNECQPSLICNVGVCEKKPGNETPPVISVTCPEALSNKKEGSIAFSADREATFSCKLDSADAVACASPYQLTALSEGDHSIEIFATAKDIKSDMAKCVWKVDSVKPTATVVPAEGAGVEITSKIVTVTFSEPVLPGFGSVTVGSAVGAGELSGDQMTYVFASNHNYPVGENTITVSGFKDAFGNVMDDMVSKFNVNEPPDTTKPTWAADSVSTSVTGMQITVNWKRANDNKTPAGQLIYEVWKKEGKTGTSNKLSTCTACQSYVDAGKMVKGKQYTYWVKAIDQSGNWRNSNEASATPSPVIGDVDGDGLADVIVGAPNADVTADGVVKTDAGKAYLHLSPSLSKKVTINGAAANDKFGTIVSMIGDVNNDGYEDFAVASSSSSNNKGKVVLFSGAPFYRITGFRPTDAVITSIVGSADNFGMGTSVSSAADVNGDGIDDFLIGTGRGIGYVVFGRPESEWRTFNFATDTTKVKVFGTESEYDPVVVNSAGDFNSDNKLDIMAGHPMMRKVMVYKFDQANNSFGEVNVFDHSSANDADQYGFFGLSSAFVPQGGVFVGAPSASNAGIPFAGMMFFCTMNGCNEVSIDAANLSNLSGYGRSLCVKEGQLVAGGIHMALLVQLPDSGQTKLGGAGYENSQLGFSCTVARSSISSISTPYMFLVGAPGSLQSGYVGQVFVIGKNAQGQMIFTNILSGEAPEDKFGASISSRLP